MNLRSIVLAATALSVVAVAQTPSSSGDFLYQIGYASNVNAGDSYVNISNDGASMTTTTIAAATNSLSVSGSFCVNVFAFNPDEELLSCCSCPVTPNGLVSLSVQRDLLNNTLTGRTNPSSVVIKLLATIPLVGGLGTTSNPCALSAGNLVPGQQLPGLGLVAWGTKLHSNTSTTTATYSLTETPFTPAELSAGEFARLNNLCAFNLAQGSSYGICNSCELAGQGAAAANQ